MASALKAGTLLALGALATLGVLVLLASPGSAAWTSPGTGAIYTMASLDAATGDVDPLAGPPACHYRVDSDITIANPDTLIIDAGCQLDFDNGKFLLIQGRLFVNGTAASPVSFESRDGNPGPGQYIGLRFSGAGFAPSRVDNLTVNWSTNAVYCNGCRGVSVHNLTGRAVSGDAVFVVGGASNLTFEDVRMVPTTFTSQSVVGLQYASNVTGRNITATQAAVALIVWNCTNVSVAGPISVGTASYGTAWVDSSVRVTLSGLVGAGHPFGLLVTRSTNVSADNLSYKGIARPAVSFANVTGAALSRVNVTGAPGDAVWLDNVTRGTATGLDLTANGTALRLTRVVDLAVTDLAVGGAKAGVWAQDATNLTVTGARVNGSAGVGVGVLIQGGSGIALGSLDIWQAAGDGLVVQAAAGVGLDQVNLTSNGRRGATVEGVSNLSLAAVRAQGNTGEGLSLSATGAQVAGLWASGNGRAGVALANGSTLGGSQVTVTGNTGEGLLLDSGSVADVAGLLASANTGNGTRLAGGAVASLTGVRLENNTLFGLHTAPGAKVWWSVRSTDEAVVSNGVLIEGAIAVASGGALRISGAPVAFRAAPAEVFMVTVNGTGSLTLAGAALQPGDASSRWAMEMRPGSTLNSTGSSLAHAGTATDRPGINATGATLSMDTTSFSSFSGGIRLNGSVATMTSATLSAFSGAGLLVLGGSLVSVDGIAVTGLASGIALAVDGGSLVQGTGLNLSGAPAEAAWLAGNSNLDIDGFEALGLGACAVCLSGGASATVRNGTLATSGSGPAIGPGPAGDVRIFDTQIAAGGGPGVAVNTSGSLTIVRSSIRSTGASVTAGGGASVTVRDSTLNSTGAEAMVADGAAAVDVRDSALGGVAGALRIEGAVVADVHTSRLTAAAGAALRVVDSSSANVTDSDLFSGGVGASFEATPFNASGLNVSVGPGATGLRAEGSAGGTLSRVAVVAGNGSTGLRALNCPGLAVADLTVALTANGTGLNISGGALTATRVTVTAPGAAVGVRLEDASASRLTGLDMSLGAGSVGLLTNASTDLVAAGLSMLLGPASTGAVLSGAAGSSFDGVAVEGGLAGLMSTGPAAGLSVQNATFTNQTSSPTVVFENAPAVRLVNITANPGALRVANSTGAWLERVTVGASGLYGILLFQSPLAHVEAASVTSVSGTGFSVASSDGVVAVRLAVTGGSTGVEVIDSLGASFANLSVTGAGTSVRARGATSLALEAPILDSPSTAFVNATAGGTLHVRGGSLSSPAPAVRAASATASGLVRLFDTPADNGTFETDTGGAVEVYWSLTLSASMDGAPVAAVEISIADRLSAPAGVVTTGPAGEAPPLFLLELRDDDSGRSYSSPYRASASSAGGFAGTVAFDLDRPRAVDIPLKDVQAPSLGPRATLRTSPNETVAFGPAVGDMDNVAITQYSWSFQNETGVAVALAGPTASYTFRQPGHFQVTLVVSDAAGNANATTYEVWVNAAPYFTTLPTPMDLTAVAGQTFRVAVAASDPDPEDVPGLRITVQSATGMAMNGSQLEWTPAEGGLFLFTLRVTDGLDIDTATFQFLVEEPMGPSNLPPVFLTNPRLDANILSPYSYSIQVEDPEDEEVTVQLISAPTGMALVQAPGSYRAELSWEPGLYFKRGAEAFNFTFDIMLRASDGHTSVWQNFTVLLRNPPDQAPVIDEISLHPLGPGETVTIDLRQFGSDPDDDASTLIWALEATGETHGTSVYLNPNNPNEFIVRAPEAWPGDQSFLVTLVLTDSSGISDRAAVQIQLKAPSAIETAFPWLLLIALIAVAGGAYALATRSRAGLLPPSEAPPAAPASAPAEAPAAAGAGSPLWIEAVALLDTSDQILRTVEADGAQAEGTLVLVPAALRSKPVAEDLLEKLRVEDRDVAAVRVGEGILVAVGAFAGDPSSWLQEPMVRALRRVHALAHEQGAEDLGSVADTDAVGAALAGVLALAEGSSAAAVAAYRKTKAVRVASAAELVGGALRLTVAVQNASGGSVSDVRLSLDYDERALRLEAVEPSHESKREKVLLGNLVPGQRRIVDFTFDPQSCAKALFNASATYEDAEGHFHNVAMLTRAVSRPCPPFTTAFTPSTGMLKRLVRSELAERDARFFRFGKDLAPADAHAQCKRAVEAHDLALLRERVADRPFAAEAWFYGQDKATGERIAVWTTVSDTDQLVQFTVAADNPAAISGLLTDLGRSFSAGGVAGVEALTGDAERQATETRKGMFSQTEEGELGPEDN